MIRTECVLVLQFVILRNARTGSDHIEFRELTVVYGKPPLGRGTAREAHSNMESPEEVSLMVAVIWSLPTLLTVLMLSLFPMRFSTWFVSKIVGWRSR